MRERAAPWTYSGNTRRDDRLVALRAALTAGTHTIDRQQLAERMADEELARAAAYQKKPLNWRRTRSNQLSERAHGAPNNKARRL